MRHRTKYQSGGSTGKTADITSLSKRQVQDFMRSSTPEEAARFERQLERRSKGYLWSEFEDYKKPFKRGGRVTGG